MKEKISCSVIIDMLQLYEEGLCSKESRTLISEHLEECESCRKLSEDLISPAENIQTVPDEAAFKKINKKIRLGKIKNRILGILLALIITAMLILTAGQIMKHIGPKELPSFETVITAVEVRSIAKKLASGNIEEYMKCISFDDLADETKNLYTSEIIRESETKVLKKLYDERFGNKKVKSIKIKTEYTYKYVEDKPVVIARAKILYTDNDVINLEFNKGSDGLYQVNTISEKGDIFMMCIDQICWHDMYSRDSFERIIEKNELKNVDKNSIEYRFAPEYKEKALSSICSFYEKGFTVTDCTFSNLKFDEDKDMIYVDTVITGSENKGQAVMQTRLWIDYTGRFVPDSEASVISDGCTEELKNSLKHFFR